MWICVNLDGRFLDVHSDSFIYTFAQTRTLRGVCGVEKKTAAPPSESGRVPCAVNEPRRQRLTLFWEAFSNRFYGETFHNVLGSFITTGKQRVFLWHFVKMFVCNCKEHKNRGADRSLKFVFFLGLVIFCRLHRSGFLVLLRCSCWTKSEPKKTNRFAEMKFGKTYHVPWSF